MQALCPIHMKALEPCGVMALCMEPGCTFGVTPRVAQEEEARLKPIGEAAVEMLRAEHGMSMAKLRVNHNYIYLGDERNTPVAVLCTGGMEYAHKFVAAPDMYDALKEALQMIQQVSDSGDCGRWQIEKDADFIRWSAAIAKAEGRAGE